MKTWLFTIIAAASMAIACQSENKEPHNAAEQKVVSKEDSLYNRAIAMHDEAMPKMGKLIGYEKLVQHQIDSIAKIKKQTLNDKTNLSKLTALLAQLKAAETGMNAWMEGFDPDPKMTDAAEREAYFAKQAAGAQKMRDDLFVALDSAASFTGK
jgi:hypothetical protein